MHDFRLLTPGPTKLPEQSRLALARQVIHHRSEEFRQLLAEVLEGLKYVFQTRNDVLLLASSGTGAMEAAVVNLVPPGRKAIVLESGKFSERWRKIAEAFGIEVVKYEVPWGEPFEPAEVARLVEKHSDAVALYTTLQETSTGVAHDIEGIARAIAGSNTLLVVDGISGVGAVECRTDAWGIDVLVAGAQKGLMGPPGLAFLSVSPRAWRQVESFSRPAFYFDLLAYRRGLAGPDTPFTPATPLVVALCESLWALRSVPMEEHWARCRLLAAAARAGLQAVGMKPVARRPADGMTAAYLPEGVDGKAFVARLYSRFGVRVSGGQGQLTGKIIRIAHFGAIDQVDLLGAIAAIELALVEFGQTVKLGSGVGAASEVLAASLPAKTP